MNFTEQPRPLTALGVHHPQKRVNFTEAGFRFGGVAAHCTGVTNSADAIVIALAGAHHGVFLAGEAHAAGVSQFQLLGRLRGGLLDQIHPGVFSPAWWPDSYERQVAAALLARPECVASHRTAARLHRLDGFDGISLIELTDPRVGTNRRLPGTLTHRAAIPAFDQTLVGGLRCTTLARTLIDIACVVDATHLRRAVDDVWRRRTSLGWIRKTAERLYRPGYTGSTRVLNLIDSVAGAAPESWFERLLAECINGHGLPTPTLQYAIRDERGRFVARVDAAFPASRLGIEAHSRRYHSGPGVEANDEARDLRAAAVGWEILYVGWRALTETPDTVAARIAAVIRSRDR